MASFLASAAAAVQRAADIVDNAISDQIDPLIIASGITRTDDTSEVEATPFTIEHGSPFDRKQSSDDHHAQASSSVILEGTSSNAVGRSPSANQLPPTSTETSMPSSSSSSNLTDTQPAPMPKPKPAPRNVATRQLEDLLNRAESRAEIEEVKAKKLAAELTALQDSSAKTQARLHSQLASHQANFRDATSKLEAAERRVLSLEAEVAVLEESGRSLRESRNDLEGGMLEALRSQLEAAESKLDAEVRKHAATKLAAKERERELSERVSGDSAALSTTQRSLEEVGSRVRDLEDRVASLLSERASLISQLKDKDQASESKSSSREDATLYSLRADLSQQQKACHAADQARRAAEQKASQLSDQLEEIKGELERHSSRGDAEVRLRELSDLIVLKQTQLERLSADKAAQIMGLEREVQQLGDELAKQRKEGERETAYGGGLFRSSSHDVIPMDSLGAPYQRLAQSNKVLGKAVKAAANFLDSASGSASFFLRQYPLVRIATFLYLVLIHLWVYTLLGRLQRSALGADSVGGRDVHSLGF